MAERKALKEMEESLVLKEERIIMLEKELQDMNYKISEFQELVFKLQKDNMWNVVERKKDNNELDKTRRKESYASKKLVKMEKERKSYNNGHKILKKKKKGREKTVKNGGNVVRQIGGIEKCVTVNLTENGSYLKVAKQSLINELEEKKRQQQQQQQNNNNKLHNNKQSMSAPTGDVEIIDSTDTNQTSNKRKLNENPNFKNKKEKITDYSLGLSIIATQPVNSVPLGIYISTIIKGTKAAKIYTPMFKQHVIQIIAKNQTDFETIKRKLEAPNSMKKAPCSYIISPMNFKSTLYDVVYSFKKEEDVKEPLELLITMVLAKRPIAGTNLSYNAEKKQFTLKATTTDAAVQNDLIQAGFKEFKTLTKLSCDNQDIIRMMLPKSFTEEEAVSIVEEIFKTAKINLNKSRITLTHPKSWWDEKETFINIEYKVEDMEHIGDLTDFQIPVKAAAPKSRIIWKGFESLGQYYKERNEHFEKLRNQNNNDLNNKNVENLNFSNFELRIEKQDRRMDGLEKEMKTMNQKFDQLLISLRTMTNGGNSTHTPQL